MTRNYGKGFTVVEIIVTIVALIILTTIVVTRLSLTQIGGRDQEREIDVETIATGLEVYYQDGGNTSSTPKGYYPGSDQVDAASLTTPPFNAFLEGVSTISYEAPGGLINGNANFQAPTQLGTNPDGSYTDSEVRSILQLHPYVYQVLKRDNAHCYSATECVKYNLYYLNEASNTVVKIRSKNQ